MKYVALASLFVCALALGDARQVDEYQWDGVGRIVAVGDVHGDYDNYIAVLRAAGLVDKKGKWSGGSTHFVQTGDVPDRGPDTQEIIEHLSKLKKQAQRKGGYVHTLIGNHEAMNVYGDLRYVHEGEFKAFVTRNSGSLRDRYYEIYLQDLAARDPERFAALAANFREQWNLEFPLGWVEHRQAWDPAWRAGGKYAEWVLGNKVAVRVNDNLFLHGGISGFYCQNSLQWITDRVLEKLKNFDPAAPGILEDEFGPLWYRGLSDDGQVASPDTVEAILAQHGVSRIVVGHTPTNGVIWPRFDGKVVVIDTGIGAAYGGHLGYLEITADGLFAGYPGGKLPLPSGDDGAEAYLEQVIALNPGNRYLTQRLQVLQRSPVAAASEAPADAGANEVGSADGQQAPVAAPPPIEVPVCGLKE
jgi:hypothetical protein